MAVTQELVDAAISQAIQRFPIGYAGAAAVLTHDGEIITSVFFESLNDATHLCHEVGAICEAYRRNSQVVASVCVSREAEDKSFTILSACGVCQERLATWGREVCIAVPDPRKPTAWFSKSLKELQPYYWREGFESSTDPRNEEQVGGSNA